MGVRASEIVPDGMPCRVIYAESAASASAVAALWCSRSTTAASVSEKRCAVSA